MLRFKEGATLASELSIQADAASGALIVRHDDVAPDRISGLGRKCFQAIKDRQRE